MRIYIWGDLEGVCGVFSWDQVRAGTEGRDRSVRELLMGEVNACVDGCFAGGATRVVAHDAHDGGRTFIPELLDERAEMIMGLYPRGRFFGLPGQEFDAAILLSRHSLSHTPCGILNHTQSSRAWDSYTIDGRPYGEIGQVSVILGSFGIPVVMVTGDEAACAEARDLLGDGIETVAVKKGLSREGALMISPRRARSLIRAGAERAMSLVGKIEPHTLDYPVTVRWRFKESGIVDAYSGAARKLDGQTLEKEVDSAGAILHP